MLAVQKRVLHFSFICNRVARGAKPAYQIRPPLRVLPVSSESLRRFYGCIDDNIAIWPDPHSPGPVTDKTAKSTAMAIELTLEFTSKFGEGLKRGFQPLSLLFRMQSRPAAGHIGTHHIFFRWLRRTQVSVAVQHPDQVTPRPLLPG